jgi:NADPH:quinone reductase-like Zn-dependent oxidoreductase
LKAVRIHNHGDISVLKWESIPKPQLDESGDDVLVRIVASSINHLDIWVRQGISRFPLPLILGSDGAGIVESCGNRVSEFHPGDEVIVQPLTFCSICDHCLNGMENYCSEMGILGKTMNGTQCEYVQLKSYQLRKKPPHLSFPDAAAFSLVTQTAYAMLVKRAKIKPGETVFIWGAGSGVGSMAIQIAHYFGCTVYAAAGTDEKVNMAIKLGAEKAWNYKNTDIGSVVKEKAGRSGVDVVFEHVGPKTWDISKKMLATGGRLVTCGATTGSEVSIDLRHLFMKQQSILGSTMSDMQTFDDMLSLINENVIHPVVDRIVPMEKVKDAHEYIETSGPVGKVVLVNEKQW